MMKCNMTFFKSATRKYSLFINFIESISTYMHQNLIMQSFQEINFVQGLFFSVQ